MTWLSCLGAGKGDQWAWLAQEMRRPLARVPQPGTEKAERHVGDTLTPCGLGGWAEKGLPPPGVQTWGEEEATPPHAGGDQRSFPEGRPRCPGRNACAHTPKSRETEHPCAALRGPCGTHDAADGYSTQRCSSGRSQGRL